MMKEFSMNIMDIVENSVRAKSPIVIIDVVEDPDSNLFSFSVEDMGEGMGKDMIESVRDPFITTRTTRRVGLGIPILEQTCEQCGGELEIKSELGKGTKIKACMEYNNIDRPPMGDIANTVHCLIIMHPQVDFLYRHKYKDNGFEIDTREIKEILDGVPLDEPSVIKWLKDTITEGLGEIIPE